MGYNHDFEINEQQIKEFLESATNKVKTQEDIETLEELRKLFRRDVPLTVRKYVLAYLLKEALKHSHSYTASSNKKNDRNDRNYRNEKHEKQQKEFKKSAEKAYSKPAATEPAESSAEDRPHHERVIIAPEDATSIFLSIGRNRRVYPRDLVGLLIGVGGLDRERIGDIKVLANYSFVQLYTDDCEQAIEKLNGYEYRGRKLTVSYSKQKSDDDDDQTAIDQNDEEAMSAEDAAAYAAAEKAAADKEPFGVQN